LALQQPATQSVSARTSDPRPLSGQPAAVPGAQRSEAASTNISVTITAPPGTTSKEIGSRLLEPRVAQDMADCLSSMEGVSAVSSVQGPLKAGEFKVLQEAGYPSNGRMSFSWQYRVS
jgi:hypothetical protein